MTTKNNSDLLEQFAALVAEKVADLLGDTGPAEKSSTKSTASKGRGKAKAEEPEDEEDEAEENEDLAERIAELKKTNIRTLRKMAIEMGFDEDEVKEAEKDELAENIAEAEAEDGDEEGEESDEDEDDDEEEDEDDLRAELEDMSLTALKKTAKEEYDFTAADLKGLDKDGLIDAILEAAEEGDEDEDDDEEGDDDYPSEEELEEMSLAELKALCKEYEIKVPRGAKAPALVELINEYIDGDE